MNKAITCEAPELLTSEKLLLAKHRSRYIHALTEEGIWPTDEDFPGHELKTVLDKVHCLPEIRTEDISCTDCYSDPWTAECPEYHNRDWTDALKSGCQIVQWRLSLDGMHKSQYLCLDCLKTKNNSSRECRCRIGSHLQWADLYDN